MGRRGDNIRSFIQLGRGILGLSNLTSTGEAGRKSAIFEGSFTKPAGAAYHVITYPAWTKSTTGKGIYYLKLDPMTFGSMHPKIKTDNAGVEISSKHLSFPQSGSGETDHLHYYDIMSAYIKEMPSNGKIENGITLKKHNAIFKLQLTFDNTLVGSAAKKIEINCDNGFIIGGGNADFGWGADGTGTGNLINGSMSTQKTTIHLGNSSTGVTIPADGKLVLYLPVYTLREGITFERDKNFIITATIKKTDETTEKAAVNAVGKFPVQGLKVEPGKVYNLNATLITGGIKATSIKINKSRVSLQVGEAEKLTATPVPAEATDVLNWNSDNTSVAWVENGVVTAVGIGSAVITVKAQDGSVENRCNVIVEGSHPDADLIYTGYIGDKSKNYVYKNGINTHRSAYAVAMQQNNDNIGKPCNYYWYATNGAGKVILYDENGKEIYNGALKNINGTETLAVNEWNGAFLFIGHGSTNGSIDKKKLKVSILYRDTKTGKFIGQNELNSELPNSFEINEIIAVPGKDIFIAATNLANGKGYAICCYNYGNFYYKETDFPALSVTKGYSENETYFATMLNGACEVIKINPTDISKSDVYRKFNFSQPILAVSSASSKHKGGEFYGAVAVITETGSRQKFYKSWDNISAVPGIEITTTNKNSKYGPVRVTSQNVIYSTVDGKIYRDGVLVLDTGLDEITSFIISEKK